jgi:hypothetical protein
MRTMYVENYVRLPAKEWAALEYKSILNIARHTKGGVNNLY